MPPASQSRRKPRHAAAGGAGQQLAFWEAPEVESPEPAPEPRKRRKTSARPSKEVARKVGEEILDGQLKPEEWAEALAETGNSDGRAVAEYAKRRMKVLDVQMIQAERKEQEMEMRKRHSCGTPTMNTRRVRARKEKPSILGILLIFLGIWGLSAAYFVQFRAFTGTSLYWGSAISTAALCSILAGIYFLAGNGFRRFLAGGRMLGIGFVLCGISLFTALSMMFRPTAPAESAGHRQQQSRDAGENFDLLVSPPTEPPPVSSAR